MFLALHAFTITIQFRSAGKSALITVLHEYEANSLREFSPAADQRADLFLREDRVPEIRATKIRLRQ